MKQASTKAGARREKRSKADAWPVRAVMLDLARQRETLETIERFISFAKDWGYNTLVLYLEGAVRTKHFPYRSPKVSYTPGDMRQVVGMAKKAGLEIVPALATLGHAEHFLECRQLRPLAETGFRHQHMFCPSNEGTYRFLEKYISDIVPLFPGKQFHISCDEAWALGCCPVCHARVRNGESRDDLFIKHVLRMHAMLRRHGKQVWIWDDMLENASEEKLAELPRDIVMMAWHYCADLLDHDGFTGQFNNLGRLHALRRYEKLGFQALVAPWARGIENSLALTNVAREYRVQGGLQTAWELSRSFLPGVLPAIALTGALWSQPDREPAQVLEEVLRRLFPSLGPVVLQAVRGALIEPFWYNFSVAGALKGLFTLEETRLLQSSILYEKLLGEALARLAPGLERDILSELHVRLRLHIGTGRFRILLPKMAEPFLQVGDPGFNRKEVDSCLEELTALAQNRAETWKRLRPGIQPDRASAWLRQYRDSVETFVRDLSKTPRSARGLLKLRLFLPDSHIAPILTVEIQAGGKWEKLCSGTFKPENFHVAEYNIQVPWKRSGPYPERLRLTLSGYGGLGVQFARMSFHDRELTPLAIGPVTGEIQNATAMLTNNSSVCLLGEPDHVKTLRRMSEKDESSVEVLFQQEMLKPSF